MFSIFYFKTEFQKQLYSVTQMAFGTGIIWASDFFYACFYGMYACIFFMHCMRL